MANRTYGDADFAISATATSGLPVSFTASGNASIRQDAGVWYVHITGAGSATVTAHQAGDASYAPAPDVAQAFTIARAASVTTTVGAGPFTYNGSTQVGGSGTVTGAGGLDTSATSLTYSANSDGTGVADQIHAGTYYVTAHYTGDANHTPSDGSAVAISILARHITGSFTAADKVYDGKISATVLTRSLVGVLGTDAVSLTGGTATFASKNVGTWTVTLTAATLGGGAAGNYILDSVATTTARITPKALTATSTTTQGAFNVAKNGTVSFRIDLNESGIVDGQSVARLFNGASFPSPSAGRPTASGAGGRRRRHHHRQLPHERRAQGDPGGEHHGHQRRRGPRRRPEARSHVERRQLHARRLWPLRGCSTRRSDRLDEALPGAEPLARGLGTG